MKKGLLDMRKKREQLEIADLLRKKRLPIVVLDARWHQLFGDRKPAKVEMLEKKLNDLLKQQGKMVTQTKDLKVAKRKLLDGIVANMDTSSTDAVSQLNAKKLDKSQKLIRQINDQLNDTDNILAEIPYKIKEANEELVIEGMTDCYQRFDSNNEKIEAYDEQIKEYKKKLLEITESKRSLEQQNEALYSYMHNILGGDIMETIDERYEKRK